MGSGLRFALPPSLGWEPVKELARSFADLLFEIGFDTVIPYRQYDELQEALLNGEVDAAWGPPVVCARLEDAGGTVALQSCRDGALTYRGVLVCRALDPIEIDKIPRLGARILRAAWVDPWSMGGYLLPRHYLRAKGVDPAEAFDEEILAGSYKQAMHLLTEGDVDIAASFASRRSDAYVYRFGAQPSQIRVLGFTEETPNDGLVISPKVDATMRERVLHGLAELIGTDRKLILTSMFDVDDFEVPPAGVYRGLLAYL